MGVHQAIEIMKRAGMEPTRLRMAVAAVAFSGPQAPVSPEELEERALDAGFCLTRSAAAEALAELREAGLLPGDAQPEAISPQAPGARLLQAMGNRHRYKVLRELLKGERCVGELQRVAGIQQSALSQHLARLRNDGLVKTRRDAIRIYYSLADSRVAAILRML